MLLLRYVMTCDTGLAPNPFHGACTLALCTPNHGNARRLKEGDWIIGHSGNSAREEPPKLIYAMKVTEQCSLDQYFNAYPEKRPKLDGDANEQCGDAIYFREKGSWRRLPSKFHNTDGNFEQDTKNERKVFIAKGDENFFYFGRDRGIDMTERWSELLHSGRNFSYFADESKINEFVQWLRTTAANGASGCIGAPADKEDPPPDGSYLESPGQWIKRGGETCASEAATSMVKVAKKTAKTTRYGCEK